MLPNAVCVRRRVVMVSSVEGSGGTSCVRR